MTHFRKSHARLALEGHYEEMKRRAAFAPQARAESDEIHAITKLHVDQMVPKLREFAAKVRENRSTAEGFAKPAVEAADKLEANHVDQNAYAILQTLCEDLDRAARHCEGIDPERDNPGPWPPATPRFGSPDTYAMQMAEKDRHITRVRAEQAAAVEVSE